MIKSALEKIRDFLKFSKLLIKENKGKLFTTILLLLTIWGLNNTKSETIEQKEVKSTIMINSEVVDDVINKSDVLGWIVKRDDINYYLLDKSSSSDYQIKDGKLIVKSISDTYVLLIILIVIFSAILLTGTLSSDSDINWNLKEIIKDFLFYKMKVDYEGENKYYTLNGKLLFSHEKNRNFSRWDIEENFNDKLVLYLKNKNILDNWESASKRRERQLKELFEK